MTNSLTTIERSDLGKLEAVVDQHIGGFLETAKALLEIRDRRLYRDSYANFESYCRERFEFTRQHANRLIKGLEVAQNVAGTNLVPTKESHARVLSQFTPDTQKAIWGNAKEEESAESLEELALEVGKEMYKQLPSKDKIALAKLETKRLVDSSRKIAKKDLIVKGRKLLEKAKKVFVKVGNEAAVKWIDKAIEAA